MSTTKTNVLMEMTTDFRRTKMMKYSAKKI